MGRPSLGAGARSVVASVRITPVEEQYLANAFGTTGAGLRALVSSYMNGWLTHPPLEPVSDAMNAADATRFLNDVADALAEPVKPGRHLHRRKNRLDDDWVNGTRVEVWECECGKEMR